jgi:hypothetical protein
MTFAANGEAMSEEQTKAEEQEVIQYAEEVDQELAQLRVAVWDLIDDLDATGGFGELEAGHGGNGPVVRLCRMTSKPLPPRLKAWLEGSGAA